jgi:hypothetical protein
MMMPNVDKIFRIESLSTIFRNEFPITIPIKISATTTGKKFVLAAFLTPIIVNRLNINFLPVVVAEILMGIVIGNSFLNIVERDNNNWQEINI